MTGARFLVAASLSTVAAALLLIEGVSWQQSARFGPLTSTTLACGVKLDTLDDADRAAGVHLGDTLLFPQMDAASRTSIVFHYTPTQAGRAGERIVVAVQRGANQLRLPYTLRHTDSAFTFAAQLAFKVVVFALAMLLLWRGFDRASIVLGVWCLMVGVSLPDTWWGLLPLDGRIAGGLLTSVLWTSAPVLLYLVVDTVATGVSMRARIICRTAMIVLWIPEVVINSIDATAQAVNGCWLIPLAPWLANAAILLQQLVIVAFFALSYVRTTGLAKQRVRWVFWAFLFSRAGVLLNLANRLSTHPLHLSGFEWATVLLFPIGCAYAILRHRIIDVNFVLNRTLLYTILTTIVVGIFVLLEDVLRGLAAGRGVGEAIQIGVALLVGLSFNAAHQRIGAWIERLLFRRKHEAANALRTLAEEAPYTESAEALLRRAVEEIRRYSGATGVAVYERVDGKYSRVAEECDESAPSTIAIDDLAFVRLRKSLGSVDLTGVASALGSNGVLFAFALRGQLTGGLVCRNRANGEAYAPDEVALLASVSHEIGAELQAIQARRQSELLDALFAGALDIESARKAAASSNVNV